jgi:protocatechuate 4,5-dioxygenase alpha chain
MPWCGSMDEATALPDAPVSDWGIPGTYVFDSTRSRRGIALNRFAFSLTSPRNRETFRADEAAYMARFGVGAAAADAVRRRDWLALVSEHGGNIYYIYKVGAAVGHGLYHMGAQMRGQTYDEFLQTRAAKGAR